MQICTLDGEENAHISGMGGGGFCVAEAEDKERRGNT